MNEAFSIERVFISYSWSVDEGNSVQPFVLYLPLLKVCVLWKYSRLFCTDGFIDLGATCSLFHKTVLCVQPHACINDRDVPEDHWKSRQLSSRWNWTGFCESVTVHCVCLYSAVWKERRLLNVHCKQFLWFWQYSTDIMIQMCKVDPKDLWLVLPRGWIFMQPTNVCCLV